MVNGKPDPETSTPRDRSESTVVFIGLDLAARSPSKETFPLARAAIGGTKRITVPANPQSICAGPAIGFGVIRSELGVDSISDPRLLRASIIKLESLDSRGFRISLGPEARAERTNSRLVRDLEPGMLTLAEITDFAKGAAHARE
jgi:hypothetical protein